MSNAVLQAIVMVILVLYCAYMFYTSIRLWKKDKAGSEEYLRVHPEAKRESYSLWQSWLMVFMAVLCFVLMFFGDLITPEGQRTIVYQITYLCLGLIFLGLSLDVWLHRRILVSEDGFFYAGDTYRYRMINGMERKRGIFHNMRLMLANGSTVEMAASMGAAVREDWMAWKEKKKEKKNRRRKR